MVVSRASLSVFSVMLLLIASQAAGVAMSKSQNFKRDLKLPPPVQPLLWYLCMLPPQVVDIPPEGLSGEVRGKACKRSGLI